MFTAKIIKNVSTKRIYAYKSAIVGHNLNPVSPASWDNPNWGNKS